MLWLCTRLADRIYISRPIKRLSAPAQQCSQLMLRHILPRVADPRVPAPNRFLPFPPTQLRQTLDRTFAGLGPSLFERKGPSMRFGMGAQVRQTQTFHCYSSSTSSFSSSLPSSPTRPPLYRSTCPIGIKMDSGVSVT